MESERRDFQFFNHRFDILELGLWWNGATGFPLPDCKRTNAEGFGKVFLCKAEQSANVGDLPAQGFWHWLRMIPQKLDYTGNVPDGWLANASFPILNGDSVHGQELGNLRLEQVALKSAGPEMLCQRAGSIGGRLG